MQSGFQFGLEFVQSPLNFLAKGAETEVDKTPRCGTQIYYGNSAICKKETGKMCEDPLQIQIPHLYLSQTLRQLLLSKDRLSHDVVKGQLYVPQ